MEFDINAYLPWIMQALGGVVGGNVLGGLTRGGGGVLGRSLAGAVGGLAAGYGLPQVEQAQPALASLFSLMEGEAGAHLGNLLVGAGGGGVLGLIAGLLLRRRA